MLYIHELFFIDIAAIIIFLVTALLSRRLGEALKIADYYKLFHAAMLFLIAAALFDSLVSTENAYLNAVSPLMRFVAGVLSVYASLKYWKWLFLEFFSK